jgi:hypothetical protein
MIWATPSWLHSRAAAEMVCGCGLALKIAAAGESSNKALERTVMHKVPDERAPRAALQLLARHRAAAQRQR